jgi:hypothetical protein
LRAGFPHSDICGSKLVCQLPAAFRRLPRPSSPVIAKASTACTYSLDPITVNAPPLPPAWHPRSQALTRLVAPRLPLLSGDVSIQSYNPVDPARIPQPHLPTQAAPFARAQAHPRRQIEVRAIQPRIAYFFQFVKEQPNNSKLTGKEQPASSPALACALCVNGGADRDRTDDPLLAKQVLSQLSYSPDPSPQPTRSKSLVPSRHATQVCTQWWVWLDLNQRPHAYQACALTN